MLFTHIDFFSRTLMTNQDELEQLKQLLLAQELALIDTLKQHVLSPQQRTQDTAEILTEAITLAAQDKSRLVAALNTTVDDCIRDIVANNPQQFADSLFPVMGPAIRKSITETLKSFVQSTNAMIEQSMSLKSLRWRWEAKRSGLPFSEVMLKHSLLYRVEEVFLIQQDSGLLIEHVSHPDVVVNDSDAISAMLTVIRDFSRDSFSAAANDSLDTLEFGERTLWIIDGPKALLASVNRGMVPKSNRSQLQTVLEDFHSRFANEIEHFSGDRSAHPELQTLLTTCLDQQSLRPAADKQKRAWWRSPVLWIVLGLTAISAYWGWQHYDQQRRLQALMAELSAIPGVVILGSETQGNQLLIRGLQDPLVAPLNPLLQKHGFSPSSLSMQMAAFQSLAPSIASQRAAQLLDAPNTLSFSSQGEELIASGTASQAWLDFALKLKDRLPGFKTLNVTQVQVSNNAMLTAQSLQASLDGVSFYFDEGSHFNPSQQSHFEAQMAKVATLSALLNKIPATATYVISAYADNTGNDALNHALKIKRAETIKQALLQNGVAAANISILAGQARPDQDPKQKRWRRADLSVKLNTSSRD